MNSAPSSVFHCIFQRHDMQLKPHPRDLEWELDPLRDSSVWESTTAAVLQRAHQPPRCPEPGPLKTLVHIHASLPFLSPVIEIGAWLQI